MADFKTHISTSTALGCLYGTAGYYTMGVSPAHCIIAGGLCSVAGMLPDLDSKSGIPRREMLSFISIVIPLLMLQRFEAMGLTPEHMVFIAAVMYVGIRFGVGWLFQRYTVHRGMWHSIPAALIAGMATFEVCLSPQLEVRLFKSWAVVLGFISHLVLDEIYAVNWRGRLPKVKKSFGTALKFFGKYRWANIATYAKLIALVGVIASDDYLMQCLCDQEAHQQIASPESFQDILHNLFARNPSTDLLQR